VGRARMAIAFRRLGQLESRSITARIYRINDGGLCRGILYFIMITLICLLLLSEPSKPHTLLLLIEPIYRMHVSLYPRFKIFSPCLATILSPSTTNAFHHVTINMPPPHILSISLISLSLSVGRASSLISLVSSPYPISRTTTSLNLNTDGVGYDLLEIISTTREYATSLIAFFVWSNPAARDNCTSQRFISMTTDIHLSEGRGGR
jgi:hypothetical protein